MKTARPSLLSNGFTIVETMIVLALAGMILLIVFEAIPALQRSSRNNLRRQDVNAILAEVSHYELNNSGNMPNPCGQALYPSCTGAGSLLENTHLSYYNNPVANITVTTPDNGNGIFGSLPVYANSLDKVQVFNLAKCNDNNATNQGAGYNDVVALYTIETGGSNQAKQCEQL
jgi:prepilin-type N-terminal cleavage/methylation domain-containing protein